MNNASSPYRKFRNTLYIIIMTLAVVLTVQLILNALVMPRMKIGQVLLESTLQLPDQTLLRMGGITGEVNYLTLDEKEVQNTYEASPLIRKAFVEKQFPNTLKIVLYGRNPLGMSLLERNNQAVPVIFDDQGVLFHVGHAEEGLDLPVLSGIETGALEEGASLPAEILPLLQDLKNLRTESPVLYGGISEVAINRKGEYLYDLTLYMKAFPTPVLVSGKLSEALLKKVFLVLDVLEKKGMDGQVEYADLRSGQVILKMREDV